MDSSVAFVPLPPRTQGIAAFTQKSEDFVDRRSRLGGLRTLPLVEMLSTAPYLYLFNPMKWLMPG
eukprot:3236072-Amphidinium_carterae.1